MAKPIRFVFNGAPTALEVQEDRMFLWVLRTELGLTGTKSGCGDIAESICIWLARRRYSIC